MTYKRDLTEQEIRTRYITPAIQQAGWKKAQIREKVYLTAGKSLPHGKTAVRGKRKRADYIIYYQPNLPLAAVEAKGNKHSLSAGMQQAL